MNLAGGWWQGPQGPHVPQWGYDGYGYGYGMMQTDSGLTSQGCTMHEVEGGIASLVWHGDSGRIGSGKRWIAGESGYAELLPRVMEEEEHEEEEEEVDGEEGQDQVLPRLPPIKSWFRD